MNIHPYSIGCRRFKLTKCFLSYLRKVRNVWLLVRILLCKNKNRHKISHFLPVFNFVMPNSKKGVQTECMTVYLFTVCFSIFYFILLIYKYSRLFLTYQVDDPETGEIAYFSHPIDIHFATRYERMYLHILQTVHDVPFNVITIMLYPISESFFGFCVW